MTEDLIITLFDLVKAGKPPKDIASALGTIQEFETFDDGINQSRFIIDSKFGFERTFVAVDGDGALDWISLDGKSLKLSFQFLERMSKEKRIHYNTWDNVSKLQAVFYPMKDEVINGVFTWIDETLFYDKEGQDILLDNVVLHFSKSKVPMPSREWVHMIEIPKNIPLNGIYNINAKMVELSPIAERQSFWATIKNLFK